MTPARHSVRKKGRKSNDGNKLVVSDLPPNLFFFAAIPMLAACFALFYLQDADVIWTAKKKQ